MDIKRYSDVRQGDINTVVHIGTADLRKGKGLANLLRCVWPRVRAKVPDARLVLAGRGTEAYDNPGRGVEGLGFVKDDRDLLGRGQIFVNSQQIGAGIQLKSVVAMLARKALVSTAMAVDGIEGKRGEHFVVAESDNEMASQIVDLIVNPERVSQIAGSANGLALRRYSESGFLAASSPAVQDFITNIPVGEMPA